MHSEVLTLKAWQRRRLLTIRAFAAAAGVSPRTVIEIGAGRRVPRPGTITAMSRVLEVAPEQVVEFRRAMGLPVMEGTKEQ